MGKRHITLMAQRVARNRQLANQLDEQLETRHATIPLRMAKAHDHSRSSGTATYPYSFDSPESSTILGARYDEKTEVLRVHFKRSKTDKTAGVYEYRGFPFTLWAEFYSAESKGQFFASRIRPIFKGEATAA